jgi:hypothetical protein
LWTSPDDKAPGLFTKPLQQLAEASRRPNALGAQLSSARVRLFLERHPLPFAQLGEPYERRNVHENIMTSRCRRDETVAALGESFLYRPFHPSGSLSARVAGDVHFALFTDDVHAESYALVADEDCRPGDQLPDFMLALAAEGTKTLETAGAGLLVDRCARLAKVRARPPRVIERLVKRYPSLMA